MQTAVDVINALSATDSRLDKEEIVRLALRNSIFEFFEGAILAYNPLITFGVKKVPLIDDIADDSTFVSTFTWEKFKLLASSLQTRAVTGNAARSALRGAADESSINVWNTWYRRIILKDFKCGITESTINKILSEKEFNDIAENYLIPVFSSQLAKNGKDHPKKLKGLKL